VPVTTTVPETTTTTTIPETTTTVPVTTTIPVTTTTEVIPVEEETTTTVPEPTPDEESEVKAEEILDSITDSGAVTEEVVDEFVDLVATGDLSTEQVQEIVDEILGANPDQEVITAIATSAEVLEELTSEQASELFNNIIVKELTDEEAEKVVAAVQEAPKEVREAFETEINVFSGGFDKYKPIGSNISVAERRAVVAVGAVLSSLPTVAASTSSSGGSRRK
jgi:polyhydroxyalkanoate synthesis regulator phasin